MSDLSFRKIFSYLLILFFSLLVCSSLALADGGGAGSGSDGQDDDDDDHTPATTGHPDDFGTEMQTTPVPDFHTPATTGHPDDFGNSIADDDDDDEPTNPTNPTNPGCTTCDFNDDDDDDAARPATSGSASCNDLNLRFQEYSATSSEVRWNANPAAFSRYQVELHYNRKRSSRWSTASVPINDGGQGSVWIESYQELVQHSMQTHPTEKYGGPNDIRITTRDKYRLKAFFHNGSSCFTGLVENPTELAPLPEDSNSGESVSPEPAEVATATLNNLRCVTYSRNSAEVLWDNHTEGVTVNGSVSAGGTSHYFANGDFWLSQSISVEVNGERVGFAHCPAYNSGGGSGSSAPPGELNPSSPGS